MRAFGLVLALSALTLLGSASPASAKTNLGSGSGATFGENAPKNYRSSQWFAFELKFSPYSPHIDSSPGLSGHPFAEIFNPQTTVGHPQPGSRLLTQLEFDFQFWHKFGSLGIGVTAGIYGRSSHSFEFDTSVNAAGTTTLTSCTIPNCVRSGDSTGLWIIPLSLLAVYRFDVLALRYKVPIVPYFKLGLAYYIWWITNGSGGVTFVTNSNNTKTYGYGGTFGWVLNPGLAILLDVLDPPAARTIDAELGINHTYLFVELHYADISGFGQANRLVLSDTTFNAGLAFEF